MTEVIWQAESSPFGSVLYFLHHSWERVPHPTPNNTHILCILSQDFMSLVFFPSLCLIYMAMLGFIRVIKPFNSITWQASSLKGALSCPSKSSSFSRSDPLPAYGWGERSLRRLAFQAPGVASVIIWCPFTVWHWQEWVGEHARAHTFLQ